MGLEEHVLLIASNDDECSFFGTGFVVHKTPDARFVITCAHVVKDLGGEGRVIVGDKPAQVVMIGSTGVEDLALLKVKDSLDAPTFKLGHSGKENLYFQIAGFQKFGDQFLSTTISGNFGKKVNLQDKKFNKRVEAWELNISGNDFLKEGNSGSPVIDRENGTVIAVVSHRHGDGKKGTAISINLLVDIWPGIPCHLI